MRSFRSLHGALVVLALLWLARLVRYLLQQVALLRSSDVEDRPKKLAVVAY